MNKYYIDVKDSEKYPITDKEYIYLITLYDQGFPRIPDKSEFYELNLYMVFFMLKEKESDEIVGFFKIVQTDDYYEIYDVCRLNPGKKNKVNNQMYNFLKRSLNLFLEKIADDGKKIILAIDKKNKYYNYAKKLYRRIGFKKTDPITMELLNNDWENFRYYALEI
jgi:ribosomal protein S18 acetylase RimI-like enzyme